MRLPGLSKLSPSLRTLSGSSGGSGSGHIQQPGGPAPLGGVPGAPPQPRALQSHLGVLQSQPPSTLQAESSSQHQLSVAQFALAPGSAAAGQLHCELQAALGGGGGPQAQPNGRPPAAAVAVATGSGPPETSNPPPEPSALHALSSAQDAAAACALQSVSAPMASSEQPGVAGSKVAVEDSGARSRDESAASPAVGISMQLAAEPPPALEANHAAPSAQQHDVPAASGQSAPAAAHISTAETASAQLGSAQSPVQPSSSEAEPVSGSKLSRQSAPVDPVDSAPNTGPPVASESPAPPLQEPASLQPAEHRAALTNGGGAMAPSSRDSGEEPLGAPLGAQPTAEVQSEAAPTQTVDVLRQAVPPQALSHVAGRPAAGAHVTGADVRAGGGPQLAAVAAKKAGAGALASPASAMKGTSYDAKIRMESYFRVDH